MVLDLERYEMRAKQIWSTVDRRVNQLKKFQDWMQREGFKEADTKALDYYLDHLQQSYDNPGTINVYFYDVLSYYEAMLIPLDPMQLKRIQRRLPTVPSKKVDFLTKEEVQSLFDQVQGDLKYTAIYSLLYDYARRSGEILQTPASPGLCWEDVDFEQGTITFCILKKKEGLVPVTYALMGRTLEILKLWYPRRPRTEKQRRELNDGEVETVTPVFDITQRAVEIMFKKHCRRAGIKRSRRDQTNRKLVPHILRHSRITHEGQDDTPIEYVSKRLAQHSDIKITLSSYRGFDTDEDRRRRS